MAEDILLKVRLDTSGARRDLAALYGDMSRAPKTSMSGGGAGGSGGGASGGVGGSVGVPGGAGGRSGGSGGFSLGPILAKLTALVSMQQLAGTGAGLAAGSIKDLTRDAIFGGQLGAARGMVAARDEVSGRLGPAYGLELVSKERLQSSFDLSMKYGAGMRAQGTAKAKAALAGPVIEELANSSVDAAGDALGRFTSMLGKAADALWEKVK